VLLISAGDAVRYGVPHDRVLRMITINPAEALGVGDRIGSLRPGKDADIALWSAVPALDMAARCIATIIDGAVVYRAE
jgi:imidazolonepropionase-like amidohydrolase